MLSCCGCLVGAGGGDDAVVADVVGVAAVAAVVICDCFLFFISMTSITITKVKVVKLFPPIAGDESRHSFFFWPVNGPDLTSLFHMLDRSRSTCRSSRF